MEITNVERWGRIGLLDGLPEDRKEPIANAYETIYQIITERANTVPDADIQFEINTFAVIRRIVEKIDINQSELMEIIKYFQTDGKKGLNDLILKYDGFGRGIIDFEAEFNSTYAETYIENYKHKNKHMETWNYQNPANKPDLQPDWNQTLVSKFNEIAVQNNLKAPIHIYAPLKFKNLFETLAYYNHEHQTLGNNVISFMNENNNLISVGQTYLEVLNFNE